jgi:SAM-dependent methyltransferase
MLAVVLFDFDEIFGDDYLYFYEHQLRDEQSERDTDDIVRFLDLHPGDSVLDAPCGHGRISNRLAARGMRVVGVDAYELAGAGFQGAEFFARDGEAPSIHRPRLIIVATA